MAFTDSYATCRRNSNLFLNAGACRVAACVGVAAVLQPRGQGARPFRNGRLVSHTPCRHARSIHDCPHGEHRCWFWHDEDDTHEEDFLNGVDAAVLAGLYGDDTDSD
jgi:hypothetical protein